MELVSIQKKESECKRSPSADPLDQVEVGDFYMVTTTDWDYEAEEDKKITVLMCVEEIGTNYVGFTRHSEHWAYSDRIHFNNFERDCIKVDGDAILDSKIENVKKQIKEKINLLVREGKNLSLLVKRKDSQPETLLPAVATKDPQSYKAELIEFKENRMPALQKEIDELSKELGILSKDKALPELTRLQSVKKALGQVENRIFTIELYCGLLEEVCQIKSGSTAPMDTPITIRQQLLYMDEETLFDYDKGGMDFEKIEDFDQWLARPENLERILPDQKGIVAFQVRRHDKDYGIPKSLYEIFEQLAKYMENKKTYLLIRNGENVYRIMTEIDFSPRLVPFEDEIGEKQFLKIDRWWDGDKDQEEIEIVTSESVEYDDHFKKMKRLMIKYNRIFIFIQGLLDRSAVFHPHPGISLMKTEQVGTWTKCIRDEEKGLPNRSVNFEEYRDQLNKSLKVGHLVYSTWYPDTYGRYYRDHIVYSQLENEVIHRDPISKIVQIRRDRSKVLIKWEVERWIWRRWPEESGHKTINRRLWIPINEVFNLTNYNPGDYKMFICDRALQGKYLKWAPQLLTAEKLSKKA